MKVIKALCDHRCVCPLVFRRHARRDVLLQLRKRWVQWFIINMVKCLNLFAREAAISKKGSSDDLEDKNPRVHAGSDEGNQSSTR